LNSLFSIPMDNYTKLLETNLLTLRKSLSGWSLDNFVVSTIETLMEIERNEYLGEVKGIDKGNGFYSRAFKSLSKNCLSINVPRTRTGDFTPNTLELVKIGQEEMNELCLSLYRRGMTSRDIRELAKELFGDSISPTKVSNLAKIFGQYRRAWEGLKMENHYKVVFCDCLFVTVRRGESYSNEAVYLAYGVREDYKRELLALAVSPTESSKIWGEILLDLKTRKGVQNIDLIVADGLLGLENEIAKVYPKTLFQKCAVHKMRNILNHTRPKEKEEMANDLRELFDNFSEEDTVKRALLKVNGFIQKWKQKYPNIQRYFREGNIEYYFTYIKFDKRVRRMIYTTNSIENLNRVIRKATKNKLSFESPDNLLDYVFMTIKDFEDKNFMRYPVTNYQYFRRTDNTRDTI